MLLYVVPGLKGELQCEDVGARRRIVRLLVAMFSVKGARAMKAEYEPLFQELLNRFNDVQAEIRELMVGAAKDMLLHHPEPRVHDQIEQALAIKLLDREDAIRERCLAQDSFLKPLSRRLASEKTNRSCVLDRAGRSLSSARPSCSGSARSRTSCCWNCATA